MAGAVEAALLAMLLSAAPAMAEEPKGPAPRPAPRATGAPPAAPATQPGPPPRPPTQAAPRASAPQQVVPQADDSEVPPQLGPLPHVEGAARSRQSEEYEEMPLPRAYRPPTLARPVPPSLALPAVRGSPSRDPVEELLVRSQNGVTFATMLDEILDELAHQIAGENPRGFSPLAVRFVRVSPNLRPTLSQTIEAKVVARLAKNPSLQQVVCVECRAVRSRVEGDDWVVTLGAIRQSELRRIAEEIGAKAFLEIDLTFQQVPAELVLAARVYRADDGHVVWASAIKGDETTAAILRTGKVPPSREEQLAELKRKLEMRPFFGYLAFIGFMYIPASGAAGGYFGLNPGIRIFERFGTQRRHVFGIQGEGMIDWAPAHALFGGTISVAYWYSVMAPNINKPDLRFGFGAGGFLAGTEGNTGIVQVMAEYVLQFRLAVLVSGLYALPVKYMGEDLGGFGGAARAAFQW